MSKKPNQSNVSHLSLNSSTASQSSMNPGKAKKPVQAVPIDHDFDYDPLYGSTAALVDSLVTKDAGQAGPAKQAMTARKEYIKPEDQALLTEDQLNEDIFKQLTTKSRVIPSNVVRFNHKEKAFVPDTMIEQTHMHFSLEGLIIHKDTEEAKTQIVNEERKKLEKEQNPKVPTSSVEIQVEDEFLTGDENPPRNLFNISERGTQTFNKPPKEKQCMTDPPPTSTFSDMASRWVIYDSYMEEQERIAHQKEKMAANEKNTPSILDTDRRKAEEGGTVPSAAKEKDKEDFIHGESFRFASKVVERMVNQNIFNDVNLDYKFWEDPSDNFRDGEGSLLPLWKFSFDKAKKRTVTSIVWNPEYTDLFAVGYGSYDFLRPTSGVIACFSLKSPSYPEFWFTTESGVMTLDFHPQHSSLLAVGLYDGRVLVFDIQNKNNRPIFQSNIKTGKHTEPVWQVKWQEEDFAKDLQFYSISSDGRVCLWTMSKTGINHNDILELKQNPTSNQDPSTEDDSAMYGLSAGTALDFNKFSEHLFLVGTEEGSIHKCSKAYNRQYLETYEGHGMAVYGVKWNPFHPKAFLSCSADWTVKVWDHSRKHPLFAYDLNSSVGSVAWAPFSSTTFAACTTDGKVHIFDLGINKHESLCEQPIVKKSKLTQIVFNQKEPIILVGDDRGGVSCLKLSPNLRVHGTPESEHDKMEQMLSLAKPSPSTQD